MGNHSIPIQEHLGASLAIQAVYKIYLTIQRYLSMTSSEAKIPIIFFIDSECVLFSLNPHVVHRQVILKNSAFRFNTIARDLSMKSAIVSTFHCPTLKNIADFASKRHANWDQLQRSKMWQEGIQEMFEDNFPTQFKKYMTWDEGQFTFYQKGNNKNPDDEILSPTHDPTQSEKNNHVNNIISAHNRALQQAQKLYKQTNEEQSIYEPFIAFLPKMNIIQEIATIQSANCRTSEIYPDEHPVEPHCSTNKLSCTNNMAKLRLQFLAKPRPVLSSQGLASRIINPAFIKSSPTIKNYECNCEGFLCTTKNVSCFCGNITCPKTTKNDNNLACSCNTCVISVLNDHYFSASITAISGLAPESQIDMNWFCIIKSLPKISSDFIRNCLRRHPIKTAYIRIGRIILTYISYVNPEIIGILKYSGKSHQFQFANDLVVKLTHLLVCRDSNILYKPTARSWDLITIEDSYFLKNQFSENYQNLVYHTTAIPLLSSKDTLLLWRLFQAQHILPIIKKDGTPYHLIGLNNMVAHLRSGSLAYVSSNQREHTRKLLAKCTQCIKQDIEGLSQEFSYQMRDPRLLEIFNPNWIPGNTVYIDVFSMVRVNYHTKSRKGTYTTSLIVIVCATSGYMWVQWVDDSTTQEVVRGINLHCQEVRRPSLIVGDNASYLKSLTQGEFKIFFDNLNIAIKILDARTQFLNISERYIKSLKSYLKAYLPVGESFYNSSLSLLSLQSLVSTSCALLNARPVHSPSISNHLHFFTPQMIIFPYVHPTECRERILELLQDVFLKNGPLKTKYPDLIISAYREACRRFLMENSLRYRHKHGSNDKYKSTDYPLIPEVGDIIFYRIRNQEWSLGEITNLSEDNLLADLRVFDKETGSVKTFTNVHVRMLKFYFRSKEQEQLNEG